MRRPPPAALSTALVFAATALALLARIDLDRGFHVDEAHKLGEARFFLLFAAGEVDHPDWEADFFARTNPPLGKYAFGAALAAGGHPVRDARFQELFAEQWRTPARLRAAIPDGALRITRSLSALAGALCVTALFAAGRRLAGVSAGLVAGGLLLGHGIFLASAGRGMTDTLLLAGLAWSLPLTLRAGDALRRDASPRARMVWLVVLPAALVTWTLGIKWNGALAGVIVGCGLLAGAAAVDAASRGRLLARGAVWGAGAALLALLLTVALNPYLWDQGLARLWGTQAVFADWMRTQQVDPGAPLFGVEPRAATLLQRALLSGDALLPRVLGGLGAWLGCAGAIAGLGILAGRLATGRPARRADAAGGLVFVAVLGGGVALWMPLDWDRYVLPPLLAACLLAGLGLGRGLEVLAAAARGGAGDGARSGRVVGLAGAAGALALLLVLAPGPFAPTRLDPLRSGLPPEDYRSAAESAPHSAARWRNWGRALAVRGRWDEAAQAFARALEQAPARPDVMRAVLHWERARALAEAGRTEEARREGALHAAALVALRDAMVSDDAVVRGNYDRIAAERVAALGAER